MKHLTNDSLVSEYNRSYVMCQRVSVLNIRRFCYISHGQQGNFRKSPPRTKQTVGQWTEPRNEQPVWTLLGAEIDSSNSGYLEARMTSVMKMLNGEAEAGRD